MSGKIRKILKSQKGFTLVELMTVLIILGVLLSIGVPKYLRIQAQAEWDADETTIENIAKAAEVYAAQKNRYEDVSISKLVSIKIIDGNMILNRINGKHLAGKTVDVSYKNEAQTPLKDLMGDLHFKFDVANDSGSVTRESFDIVVLDLIGQRLY